MNIQNFMLQTSSQISTDYNQILENSFSLEGTEASMSIRYQDENGRSRVVTVDMLEHQLNRFEEKIQQKINTKFQQIKQEIVQIINAKFQQIKSQIIQELQGNNQKPINKINNLEIYSQQNIEINLEMVQFNNRNPHQFFFFEKIIGQGGFYEVWKCISSNNTISAIKLRKNNDGDNIDFKIKSQIYIMKQTNPCQYITKFLEAFHSLDRYYIQIQYMNGGNLNNFIKFYRREISDQIISYIVFCVVQALIFIHNRRIIHCDVKSYNILINSFGQVKLSDFCSALQIPFQKNGSNLLKGTSLWMAPQMILKKEYNYKVDVWALGILIIELVKVDPPHYRQPTADYVMYKIARSNPQVVQNRCPKLIDFVTRCLQKDPTRRITAKQLLTHPFLRQARLNKALLKLKFAEKVKQMMRG